jgi:hypothetical protein
LSRISFSQCCTLDFGYLYQMDSFFKKINWTIEIHLILSLTIHTLIINKAELKILGDTLKVRVTYFFALHRTVLSLKLTVI